MNRETMRKLLKILIDGAVLVLVTVALLIFALWISGCARQESRFKAVEHYGDLTVYVDKETGIGYGAYSNWHTMFPLYDAEGNHYRPNGWRDN